MAGGAHRYRIVAVCTGVPEAEGTVAAADIATEFADHRTHHQNVRCDYAAGNLTLTVENDFDENGLATVDEFSDCISAYIAQPFDGSIEVQSITSD